MMKQLGLCIALFFATNGLVFGQNQPTPKPAPKEVSDPKAKVLLDKLKKQYEGYKSLETTFSLTVQIAGAKADVQKGKMIQQGAQYAMTMDKQAVFCDGKTVWFYQKKINEVQVSSVDINGESPILGPKQLIKLYQSGQYLYAITGEGTETGKAVQYIEFKPIKRNGEYSKIRMAIEKTTGQIVVCIRLGGQHDSRRSACQWRQGRFAACSLQKYPARIDRRHRRTGDNDYSGSRHWPTADQGG